MDKEKLEPKNEVSHEEDFAALLAKYNETATQLKPGNIVQGKIVGIFDTEILVDAGGRSEGILKREEITAPDGSLMYQEGDTILVMLESGTGSDQQLRVSYRKASRARRQAAIEESIAAGKPVEGRVTEIVKGGLLVDVGMRAFVPASQIDEQYVEDLKPYVGQSYTFKVIQHDLPNGKLILSRKAILNEGKAEKRRETLTTLAEGQHLQGTVKRMMDYGVFVDIGGVEGLLHISEMSWRRIHHPGEMFKIGDQIEVEVLKYDREKNRISLGYRRREDDPWLRAGEVYPEGALARGIVRKLENFGAFVELESGIQGLIPVSEISWTRRVSHPDQVLKLGDEVDAVVTRIDSANRKLSLSLRKVSENPWEIFARDHQPGQTIAGRVSRVADFGIFVEIAEGIEGLVHISEIAEAPSKHLLSNFQPGQEVLTKVLGIDLAGRKISLSLKAVADEGTQGAVREYLEAAVNSGGHNLGESFPQELRQKSHTAE
ncbi:MAG: S1 RNA-binding domain-containing protein [Terriglobia bacterium]